MLVFTRVYVGVQAKLTFVSFFGEFFFAPFPESESGDYFDFGESGESGKSGEGVGGGRFAHTSFAQ